MFTCKISDLLRCTRTLFDWQHSPAAILCTPDTHKIINFFALFQKVPKNKKAAAAAPETFYFILFFLRPLRQSKKSGKCVCESHTQIGRKMGRKGLRWPPTRVSANWNVPKYWQKNLSVSKVVKMYNNCCRSPLLCFTALFIWISFFFGKNFNFKPKFWNLTGISKIHFGTLEFEFFNEIFTSLFNTLCSIFKLNFV